MQAWARFSMRQCSRCSNQGSGSTSKCPFLSPRAGAVLIPMSQFWREDCGHRGSPEPEAKRPPATLGSSCPESTGKQGSHCTARQVTGVPEKDPTLLSPCTSTLSRELQPALNLGKLRHSQLGNPACSSQVGRGRARHGSGVASLTMALNCLLSSTECRGCGGKKGTPTSGT